MLWSEVCALLVAIEAGVIAAIVIACRIHCRHLEEELEIARDRISSMRQNLSENGYSMCSVCGEPYLPVTDERAAELQMKYSDPGLCRECLCMIYDLVRSGERID